MSRTEDTPRRRGTSLFNWMGTLVLAAIPGVNLVALILFAIFGRSRAKRTFAAAGLILMGICAVLLVAAFLLFGAELVELAGRLAAE